MVATCRAAQSLQLRAPRLRLPRGGTPSYQAGRDDAERVTRDYEARARNQRMASSLVDELKQRMRGMLELRGATEFGGWSLGPGSVSLFIDVRDALKLAPLFRARIAETSSQPFRRRGLRRATIVGAVRTLSTMLTQAVEDNLLPGNPAQRLGRYLRSGDEEEFSVDPLTADEVATVLDLARVHFPD